MFFFYHGGGFQPFEWKLFLVIKWTELFEKLIDQYPVLYRKLSKTWKISHFNTTSKEIILCYLLVLFYFLGPSSSASMNKSSTLPLSHRLNAVSRERLDRDRDRDGYYSDRNELIREREKERERERGYLSDHNSRLVK